VDTWYDGQARRLVPTTGSRQTHVRRCRDMAGDRDGRCGGCLFPPLAIDNEEGRMWLRLQSRLREGGVARV
jgi:hypothetical protein